MSNKTDWMEKKRMKRREKKVKLKMKHKANKMKGQTSGAVISTDVSITHNAQLNCLYETSLDC